MFGKPEPGRTGRKSYDPMKRKIPLNPKYSGVQSKVNSGTTVHKIQQISAKEYLKRRDEQYKRVGPISLYELFEEYEPKGTVPDDDVPPGGLRIVSYDAECEGPEYTQPYLILDVRSPQEYDIGHISQSRSFPAVYINQDKISPELYSFKNKEETLIIVYCDDEQRSRQAAQSLTEKGYENTFLLSGGFLEFADRFPMFVWGDSPQLQMARDSRSSRSRSSYGAPLRTGRSGGSSTSSLVSHRGARNIPNTGRSGRNVASSGGGSGMGRYQSSKLSQQNVRMMGGAGSARDLDTVSEAASTASVAASVISRASQKRGGVRLNRGGYR